MTCLSTATAQTALHAGLPGPIAETNNPPRHTVVTPTRPGEPTGIWDMVGSLGLVLEPSKPNTPILRWKTDTPGILGPRRRSISWCTKLLPCSPEPGPPASSFPREAPVGCRHHSRVRLGLAGIPPSPNGSLSQQGQVSTLSGDSDIPPCGWLTGFPLQWLSRGPLT